MSSSVDGTAPRTASAPQVWLLSASWFVTLTVFASLTALLQLSVTGRQSLPLDMLVRGALVVQVFVAALVVRRRSALPSSIRLPLLAFLALGVLSAGHAAVRSGDLSTVLPSFLFMYSVAFALGSFLFGRVDVRDTWTFRALAICAVGYGALQVVRQDLFLPDSFRDLYGVVYDEFSNGRLRAQSFFASAPRFAEFLVLIALYCQHNLLVSRKSAPMYYAVGYLVCLILLFNTFSRSGYVLWAVAFLVHLVAVRGALPPSRHRAVAAMASAAVTLVASGFLLGVIRMDRSVADQTSLIARRGHWEVARAQMVEGDWWQVLIGAGVTARFSRSSNSYFVLDNVFLALVLYGGFLTLTALVLLYAGVLRALVRIARLDPGSGVQPILAMLMGLGVEGMFVDNHNTLFLVLFVAVAMIVRSPTAVLPDATIADGRGSPFVGLPVTTGVARRATPGGCPPSGPSSASRRRRAMTRR